MVITSNRRSMYWHLVLWMAIQEIARQAVHTVEGRALRQNASPRVGLPGADIAAGVREVRELRSNPRRKKGGVEATSRRRCDGPSAPKIRQMKQIQKEQQTVGRSVIAPLQMRGKRVTPAPIWGSRSRGDP